MKSRKRSRYARAWTFLLILTAPAAAKATTASKSSSLVDLVAGSELILRGKVVQLADGFDERGIPYTEVTLRVAEAVKGEMSGEYKFRQFGLLKPRRMADGRSNLMVTPSGWARFEEGEDTILFLNRAAAWTGLRTTAGLAQGKFTVRVAGAVNQVDNAGLFRGVEVDPSLLHESDRRVLSTKKGPVNARAFLALVRQAVRDRWVEKGRMRYVQP